MAEEEEKRSKVGISEPTVNYCAPLHSCEPTECTTSLLSLSVPPQTCKCPKWCFHCLNSKKMDFALPGQGKWSSSSLWYFVYKGAPNPLTNNCFNKKVTDTKVGGEREINFYEEFYSFNLQWNWVLKILHTIKLITQRWFEWWITFAFWIPLFIKRAFSMIVAIRLSVWPAYI